MTEYGADTIAGLHKFPPVTFSEEFQCAFLENTTRPLTIWISWWVSMSGPSRTSRPSRV